MTYTMADFMEDNKKNPFTSCFIDKCIYCRGDVIKEKIEQINLLRKNGIKCDGFISGCPLCCKSYCD